jgi:sugar phosphate isomerase/epimerase
MRYLVTAKVKPEKVAALRRAIETGALGKGSVAYGEYTRVLQQARQMEGGGVKWVEVCYCDDPLNEERPYWEEYFEIVSIKDAHNRANCRDLNGAEAWACGECDCTEN